MLVESYQKCQCGAITVWYDNGEVNSILEKNMDILPVDTRESLDTAERLQDSYCCNHCVNHYGLDICECGSGESPENCCKAGVREEFGKSVKLFEEMAGNAAKNGGFW